ncbi:unnamed protein product [Ceratitis capitata]|uniref:(Mediterranean fruit fly) hypothetical protein n=1 Tax=Ceratitis capitata TaxID=7213 RepID=A0A811TYB5_CERCA|nr:unnamed protein product [Ceratitis capitata]
MDVGELLSFKPEQTPKRPHEDDDDYLANASVDRSSRDIKKDEKSKRMRRIEQAKESADLNKPDLPTLDSFLVPNLQKKSD